MERPQTATGNATCQGQPADIDDPELGRLIVAWPSLPAEVRAEVLRLIEGGQGGKQ